MIIIFSSPLKSCDYNDDQLQLCHTPSFDDEKKALSPRSSCNEANCNRVASYALHPHSTPVACFRHRRVGYFNVSSRKCSVEGCQVTANYSWKNSRAERCGAHRLRGMEHTRWWSAIGRRSRSSPLKPSPTLLFTPDSDISSHKKLRRAPPLAPTPARMRCLGGSAGLGSTLSDSIVGQNNWKNDRSWKKGQATQRSAMGSKPSPTMKTLLAVAKESFAVPSFRRNDTIPQTSSAIGSPPPNAGFSTPPPLTPSIERAPCHGSDSLFPNQEDSEAKDDANDDEQHQGSSSLPLASGLQLLAEAAEISSSMRI